MSGRHCEIICTTDTQSGSCLVITQSHHLEKFRRLQRVCTVIGSYRQELQGPWKESATDFPHLLVYCSFLYQSVFKKWRRRKKDSGSSICRELGWEVEGSSPGADKTMAVVVVVVVLPRYSWAWHLTPKWSRRALRWAGDSFECVPRRHPYVAGRGSSILPVTPIKKNRRKKTEIFPERCLVSVASYYDENSSARSKLRTSIHIYR